MGTSDADRDVIERILTEYAQIRYAYGDIATQTVFDRVRDHYLLVNVGWDQGRVHGCPVPVDVIDGKYWIQRDGTERGIARDLEEIISSQNMPFSVCFGWI